MYVCFMYVSVCVYVCIICVHVCVYVCTYECMYVYMYVCMCVWMYVCIYVCMCVCVSVHLLCACKRERKREREGEIERAFCWSLAISYLTSGYDWLPCNQDLSFGVTMKWVTCLDVKIAGLTQRESWQDSLTLTSGAT